MPCSCSFNSPTYNCKACSTHRNHNKVCVGLRHIQSTNIFITANGGAPKKYKKNQNNDLYYLSTTVERKESWENVRNCFWTQSKCPESEHYIHIEAKTKFYLKFFIASSFFCL